jgi:hypothetical protein
VEDFDQSMVCEDILPAPDLDLLVQQCEVAGFQPSLEFFAADSARFDESIDICNDCGEETALAYARAVYGPTFPRFSA